VGLYNWSAETNQAAISLKQLRLPEDVPYAASPVVPGPEKIMLADGILTVYKQPGESLRIINLRAPATH
jgi:hypothetical protein